MTEQSSRRDRPIDHVALVVAATMGMGSCVAAGALFERSALGSWRAVLACAVCGATYPLAVMALAALLHQRSASLLAQRYVLLALPLLGAAVGILFAAVGPPPPNWLVPTTYGFVLGALHALWAWRRSLRQPRPAA